jgi:hypothetical protein
MKDYETSSVSLSFNDKCRYIGRECGEGQLGTHSELATPP